MDRNRTRKQMRDAPNSSPGRLLLWLQAMVAAFRARNSQFVRPTWESGLRDAGKSATWWLRLLAPHKALTTWVPQMPGGFPWGNKGALFCWLGLKGNPSQEKWETGHHWATKVQHANPAKQNISKWPNNMFKRVSKWPNNMSYSTVRGCNM